MNDGVSLSSVRIHNYSVSRYNPNEMFWRHASLRHRTIKQRKVHGVHILRRNLLPLRWGRAGHTSSIACTDRTLLGRILEAECEPQVNDITRILPFLRKRWCSANAKVTELLSHHVEMCLVERIWDRARVGSTLKNGSVSWVAGGADTLSYLIWSGTVCWTGGIGGCQAYLVLLCSDWQFNDALRTPIEERSFSALWILGNSVAIMWDLLFLLHETWN